LTKLSFNKTFLTTLFLLSCSVQQIFAQTDPQFTQYAFNQFYLNPGAAGMGNNTHVSAFYRTQWTGYTGTFDPGGSPTTQLLTASIPFATLNGGIGIVLANDQIGGGSTNREVSLAYSYHKRIGNNLIGLGVSAGMYNRSLNGGDYRPRESEDPAIPTSKIGQSQPDVSAGIYLYNPSYQLGLSVKHINQPSFGFSTLTGKNPLSRALYLSGSLLIGVSYTLDISPVFVIKSDFKTVSPEVGALVSYNSAYWAGINFRWQDAASFLIGGNFLDKKLSLGYAIDYVIFGTLAKQALSHELMFKYALSGLSSGKKSIIRTPRYRY
jgi:type IX secretion system PorP/SprF family membrane protein